MDKKSIKGKDAMFFRNVIPAVPLVCEGARDFERRIVSPIEIFDSRRVQAVGVCIGRALKRLPPKAKFWTPGLH